MKEYTIRKFKIAKLLNNHSCLNDEEKSLYIIITSWIKDLQLFELTSFPNKKFYLSSDGLVVLERSGRNDNNFMIRYDNFYKRLVNEHSFSKEIIHIILKFAICDYFYTKGEKLYDISVCSMNHGTKTIEKFYSHKRNS